MTFHAYIPQDRLRALAQGESMPDRAEGTALFADISGFTPLTERLTREWGVRRGIEELTQRINSVYDVMIVEIDRFGGIVVNFAGDAVTCWFDASFGNSAQRAVTCARVLQDVLKQFPDLSLKIAVCTGPVRRFAIGDPSIHLIDTLAGVTIARLAVAEHQAKPGNIILDRNTVEVIGIPDLTPCASESGEEFFIFDPSKTADLPASGAAAPPAEETDVQADPDVIRPWIPPLVYERESAGYELLLTDLRPTTAVFIRFTGIDYDNDPGAREKLHVLVSGIQRVLDRHEGSLLELTIGDKGSYLYASFGATHIHENDSLRAIHAAMEIMNRFANSDILASIQIGASSGTMRVGGYGGRNRKSFSALGNEVNLAARLMTTAAPGEILVSRRVQKAGAQDFAFEARAPIPIKGKSEPVPVFAVLGSLQHRAIRLKEPMYTLPMIGRQNELNLIAKKLDQAAGGRGQIIGVTGEAGMGKSRLVAEGLRLARRRNLLGYGGTCQSDGTNTPYLVWNPIWNAYFNLDPDVSLRKQIRTIEGELEDSVPEHLDALPLLGAILGLPLPENDFTRSLQPSDRKTQLETMLVKCLQFTAKEAAEEDSGLLLVLEDLHWIDPVSLDLLAHVAREIENLPILILLSYRPPELDSDRLIPAPFQGMGHFTQITLTELNSEESEHVIRAKLAHLFPEQRGGVPAILILRITERAQGNPFYVEELLNYMHDRGINPHDLGTLKSLELPASLHSLILSRIDQLSASQQLTLKVASIIGRIFQFDHLHNYYPALGTAGQVISNLQILERLDLTPLESPEPDLTYIFKHLVTHEVGYESIAYGKRAELHGQYAAFLERTYSKQIEKIIPQLAHHYEKASIQDKARHYLFKAGEQAAANFANEEALSYFNRALNLVDDFTQRFQFDVLLKREGVYGLIGRRAEQRQDLDDLDQLAVGFEDAPYIRSQLALRRVKLEIDEDNYLTAHDIAQAAIRGLMENPETGSQTPDLLVDALWLDARALFYAGKATEAKPQLERTLDLARRHGYVRGEYNALAQLGVWHWYNGETGTAYELLKQALDLIRKSGDIRREVDMLINLGIVAKDLYRFDASLAHYEQAQKIVKKIGDRSGEAALLNNMGRAAIASGDFASAIPLCDRAAKLAFEVNTPTVQGLALHNQSEAYRELGQYTHAREAAEASIYLLHTAGYSIGEADALENLARIEFSLGNPDRALEHAGKALAIAREISARRVEVSLLTRLGLMRLKLGQIEQADEVFHLANQIEAEYAETIPQYEIRAGLAEVTLAKGGENFAVEADALARDLTNEILHEPPTEQAQILPLSLYETCIRILQAGNDPRADNLISRAQTELRRRSEKIIDAGFRADFLAIPEHQVIVRFETGTSAGN